MIPHATSPEPTEITEEELDEFRRTLERLLRHAEPDFGPPDGPLFKADASDFAEIWDRLGLLNLPGRLLSPAHSGLKDILTPMANVIEAALDELGFKKRARIPHWGTPEVEVVWHEP